MVMMKKARPLGLKPAAMLTACVGDVCPAGLLHVLNDRQTFRNKGGADGIKPDYCGSVRSGAEGLEMGIDKVYPLDGQGSGYFCPTSSPRQLCWPPTRKQDQVLRTKYVDVNPPGLFMPASTRRVGRSHVVASEASGAYVDDDTSTPWGCAKPFQGIQQDGEHDEMVSGPLKLVSSDSYRRTRIVRRACRNVEQVLKVSLTRFV